MPFVYRLQKVLVFRIQKRDKQMEAVRLAQMEVMRIQAEIDETKNTLLTIKANMKYASHIMMDTYDKYIKHLFEKIDELELKKQEAILKLEEEKEKLQEFEKGVKILEKHKEKQKEAYLEEEKKAEMKRLDETAGLKHYAKTQERIQEELEEEGMDLDEY